MILGVHHVQLTIPVGLEEEARRFYCGTLGIAEIAKPASLHGRGGFWLRAGSSEVHVSVEAGIDRTRTKAHIAWQVDDLGTWSERLSTWGIIPLESISIPGYHRFEFRDPFGNRVEFIQPKVQE